MNRTLYQDNGSLDKRTCDLHLKFTAGTSGAIPSTFTYAEGIAAVELTTTGTVKVSLQDSYVALLNVYGTIKQASASTATAAYFELLTDDVAPSSVATTPSLTVVMRRPDTGALVDMATGDVFYMTIELVH
jgi:hypothetical protein